MIAISGLKKHVKLLGWLCLAPALLITAGCGTRIAIQLEPDLPVPLIQSLPLRVGVFLAPELDNYVFDEQIKGHGHYKIALGNTQSHMFNMAFDALFDDVVPVQSFDSRPSGLDALLVPRLHEVQIAVPQQTRTELYEVWLRYSIELYTADGQEVHKWPFAAYGKVNKQNYQMLTNVGSTALDDASNWAMRDAVATISFFFVKEPKIRTWLTSLNLE